MANAFNFRATDGRIESAPPVARPVTLWDAPAAKPGRPAEEGPVSAIRPVSTVFAPMGSVTDRVAPWSKDFRPAIFADECRQAALTFMEGTAPSAQMWSKRDLAMWLTGPYRALTASHVDADAAPPSSGRLTEHSLASLMEEARAEVLVNLADLRDGEWAPVTDAMREGRIHSTRSAGELVWIPIHRPGLRLAGRVLSLFLVDYLFAADPYESALNICTRCERVSFNSAGCSTCVRPTQSSVREILVEPVPDGLEVFEGWASRR